MTKRAEAAELLFDKIIEATKTVDATRPSGIGTLEILAQSYAKVAEWAPGGSPEKRTGRTNLS